jgi:uncharacterized protein YcbX
MADDDRGPPVVGRVASCHRYPVKSFQGLDVEQLEVATDRIVGDRTRGIVGTDGLLLSAKQRPELLHASADDTGIELPDGRRLAYDDPAVDPALCEWLGTKVMLAGPGNTEALHYSMTFDPPDDGAELVDIPVPAGTLLDVAPVHLLTTATLAGAAGVHPGLDWSVRRFRPNLVLDIDAEPFIEDTWVGRSLAIGSDVILHIDQPTVRCAMPLRAQPGLARQVEAYRPLTDLNKDFPYHFGSYVSVARPGRLTIGDEVRVLS